MRKPVVIVLLLALLAGAGWWWLRPKAIDASAPLAFVPADTPYVMANIEPIPASLVAVSMAQMGMQSELLALQLQQARLSLSQLGDNGKPIVALLDALQAEFGGKSPEQQFALLGVDPASTRFAIYGLGVSPVFRISLTDPDALRQTVGRLEAQLGMPLANASVGEHSYWQFALADAPVQAIAAIVGNHLVLSMAARDADEATLRSVLGLDRPAQSLLASGGLNELNSEFGFGPSLSGYFDSHRAVAAVLGRPSLADQSLFAALAIPPLNPDAQCREEYTALASAWPRAVFGYTRLDTERADALSVLESRADIATQLMRLRAPMPGLQTITADTTANFGFSVNLVELPKLITEFTGAIAASPWQCAQLAPLNKAAADAAKQANNPGLSMAAPLFSGMHLALSSIQWDADATIPEVAGRLVIASGNPASLLGMARSMLPGLGQAQIPDDGSVVALPEQPGLPITTPMFAAMQGNAIAIGLGESEQSGLAAFLASDAKDQPLLVAGATGAFYGQFGEWQLRMLPDGVDAATRETAEQEAKLMAALYPKMFRRAEARVDVTERGIEMSQTVWMPHTP